MHTHIFRKLIGLAVLYAVIIIGIFTLQFKSDSIIRKNIHAMRITLAETENENRDIVLKNQVNIAYNGMQFIADDKNPASYTVSGSISNYRANLVSWEQTSDLSCNFTFTNNIIVSFTLSDDTNSATLTVSASMPSSISSFAMYTNPYYSVIAKTDRQQTIAGRNVSYALRAPQFSGNSVVFLASSPVVRYSEISTHSEFSFAQVASLPESSDNTYRSTLSKLASTIISSFTRSLQSDASFASSITEQTAISYTAAMANAGRYTEAQNSVPSSFIRGNRRTYQSVAYFGSLSTLLPTLEMQMQNFRTMTMQALQSKDCSIFETPNISDYLLINQTAPEVTQLITMPSLLTDFTPTISQAAGILEVYSTLFTVNRTLAEPLQSVLEPSVQIISDACNVESDKILITENDSPVSVYTAAKIANALISYGKVSAQSEIEACGRFIVNSYISEPETLDLRTLCEVYPILEHSNPYYPHFEILGNINGSTVWTWTCARTIAMTQNSLGDITLNVDFPTGLSHYMIINNIEPFNRIQFYNINFRTDPQFEIYNSSGYVYRLGSKALLIKSRHRQQNETIRLFYSAQEEEDETLLTEGEVNNQE